MTLVQLRHFMSLARTGSFSQSAVALHLTQPALSRSIRALEAELGQPLFDRIGRSSELTPFGRVALERARELVQGADALRDSGPLARDGVAGVLRLGMGSGPGAMLMTALLLQTARERPRLQLDIARASTVRLLEGLRERTLDALVVDVRSVPPAPDLQVQALREMAGAFLVRPGHPLATQGAGVRFEDLRAYPIASTPLSDEVARVLTERYGASAHPDVCVTVRCDELPSLVTVAQHSDTVLLAIRAAAPDLVELPMQPPLNAAARFGLVTLARHSPPPALDWVRAVMDTHLVDPPAAQGDAQWASSQLEPTPTSASSGTSS